jgi:transcriptional regulator with XRE-family HTH domain
MDYLVKNLNFLYATSGGKEAQAAAAKAANIGQPAFSKILDGSTKVPGYSTVAGLARHYGVSVDDLIFRDIEVEGRRAESQPERIDDEIISQAVALLYLIADHRPDDARFSRISWPMIKVAAKAIQRAEAGATQRAVIAEILAEI